MPSDRTLYAAHIKDGKVVNIVTTTASALERGLWSAKPTNAPDVFTVTEAFWLQQFDTIVTIEPSVYGSDAFTLEVGDHYSLAEGFTRTRS